MENDHQQTTKQRHETLLLLLLLLLLDKHSHRRSGGSSGGGKDKHGTLTYCVVSDLRAVWVWAGTAAAARYRV